MAHFAKIDENNIVTKIIVADQEAIDTQDGTWIQTSYNTYGGKHYDSDTGEEDSGTPLRKNYAGKGYTYDSVRDVFIPPTPFPSWTLDETTCLWEAPVSYPTDDKLYNWDEDNQQWKVWTTEE
jgi:hypothetical protein